MSDIRGACILWDIPVGGHSVDHAETAVIAADGFVADSFGNSGSWIFMGGEEKSAGFFLPKR